MGAIRRTGSRRVSTDAAPGSDPTPQTGPDGAPVKAREDTDEAWGVAPGGAAGGSSGASGANDERLKQDVPPHW